MIGLRPRHLVSEVIRPTLMHLGDPYNSPSAQQLLLGTAIAESQLMWLHQLGNGPARGLWQMEPATHDDHVTWLQDHLALAAKVRDLLGVVPRTGLAALAGNLYYACAMCRVHYWRVQRPLPEPNDVHGMAQYWKQHYNTPKGAGTVMRFIQLWHEAENVD